MTALRRLPKLAAALLALLIPTLASAATTEFKVLFDVDRNAATGCTVNGMLGVEQVLVATVEVNDGESHVTQVHRQVCSAGSLGGVLGGPIDVDPSSYSAAGGSGLVIAEMRIPYTAFNAGGSMPTDMRLGFVGVNGSDVQSILKAQNEDIIFPDSHPGRRRAVNPGGSRNFVLDGQTGDWGGVEPLAPGAASSGSQNLRIINVRGDGNGTHFYFRFDADVSPEDNEAPTNISLAPTTVSENEPAGTVVGTFTTDDPNAGDTFTYSLVSGAGSTDNALFTISGGGDLLRTAVSFDFEAGSTYSIRVRSTDSGGLSVEKQFTIAITNANDTPFDIALSNNTTPENQPPGTTIGTFSTSDQDPGDTFTYTLVSGSGSTDNASFQIVGNALQNAGTLDFDAQSSYSIRVRSTDNGGAFFEKVFTITVTNVNETPTNVALTATTVAENQPAGTAVGTFSSTDPDFGDTFTYTLVAGAGSTDNASFSISGNQLLTAASFDFETKSSYSIRVRTTDAGGLFFEKQFTITITNVNETPTDIALSASTVAENQPAGTSVGTFSTTDVDAGDTHTYTLVAGAGSTDNASFSISGNQLLTAASFDFETKSSYSIRVRSTDAGGLFFEKVFTITVTNVNDAPTDMALSNATAPENQPVGTTIGTLSTTDQDAGDTFTYTLVGGTGSTDNASFQIVGNALQNAVNLNFEAKSSYSVRIRTTDAGGLFFEKVFVITLTNVNETPTDLALSPSTVNENQPAGTAVGTFSTTDPDAGDTFTYTLVAGAGSTDNASFSISGNQLLTAAMFDFETKSSYSIRVRTTDAGGLFFEKQLTITINNVNDAPTDIALSANTVAENQPAGTAVGTFSTTDPDAGDTFTYTLVAGAGSTDNASFTIAGNQLQTAASFDFETKSSYSIRVRSTDAGGLFVEKVFTITVTNANETPTDIALSNATAPENQPTGTTIGTFSTTDIDAGDTFTYTLVSGTGSTDNASFQIVGNALQNAVNLDFEAQSSYSIRVRTTDAGGLSFEKVFVITLTNVNEAPTDLALTPSTVAENQPSGTVVGALSTTDPDAGDTFTYTLVAGAGSTDNASFSISGGNLVTAASFDFETKSSYSVRIRTTDAGGLFYEEQVTITVTNANDAPTDIALSSSTVAENQPSGTAVGTFSTTDADAGDTFTYTLVAGAGSTDNASFSISGNQLLTAASFDFETKSSYSIRVRSTDAAGLFFEKVFTITVTDVNDAPTDMALSNATAPENQPVGTTIGTLSTTDQDAGDTFTYTLVSGTGSTDNASFQIVGNALQNAVNLDFEAQPSYSVRIRTTDAGGLFFEKVFVITVTNVNEAPTDLALSPATVAENQPIGTTVGALSSTDPDLGDTFTYTLVAGTGDDDNASFSISGSNLLTAASFDFETKSSYTVRIRTTDAGGLFYEEQVTITVTNVNEAPTDIALSANTVAENQAAGTTVGTLSTTDVDAGDTHTYTLVTGAGDTDNASFTIAGNQLQTAASFDFETKSSYTVRIRTTDAAGLFYEEAFTITVTNANETPTDIALSNATAPENQPVGTTIGTLSTTDPDAGDTFTYTLVAGTGDTDNASFQIVGNALQNAVNLDFEAQPSYTVRIRTTDAGGLFYEEAFTITITNANEAPTDLALSPSTVAENQPIGTTVGALSSTDPDLGDTFTYTLVAGTGDDDNASFSISGSNLLTAASFDFETKSSYTVRIRTTDAGGLFYEEQVTITVTNVNEAPTDIALSANTVAENQPAGTTVGTLSTTDVDAGDTHTYTLVTGAGDTDNASFTIVGNQLQTAASFDFETKSSYTVRIRTTDAAGLFYEEAFTITVTNANETPTDIALSNATAPENQATGTTIGTFSTTDPDAGDTFTYTLVAGTGSTDNASFQIVGNALQNAVNLNFEAQPSYSIRVRTTDAGGLFFEKVFTITLTNVNEAPTDLALTPSNVNEDQPIGTTVGALTSTDPDLGDTFTYTLVPGAGSTDNASFTISGSNLLTAAVFDYETKTSYSVRIRTTDAGGLFYEEQVTISINNLNDPPTDIALSANTVAENQPSGTVVGTFSTTDIDPGDTHTYTLVAGAGSTDNASFTIVGNQLQTAASFNFEAQSSYSIRVRSTDSGGAFFEKVFTITVTNANETPTDIALSNATTAENNAVGTPIGTFSTTDQDAGDTFTYTLVAGTGDNDNASFQIVGNQLQNAVNLNFEAQSSYTIRVRTTDAGGLFFEKVFIITVTDANDAPTALGLSPQNVNENQPTGTVVGTFTTTDQEAQTYTYTLVPGAGSTDNASFTISGNQLQTAAVFNFEAKSSYDIRVRTTDNGTPSLFFEQTFTITVNNVNEAPTDINLSATSIAENQPAASVVGTFSSVDPDTADTFTYTLVAGTGSADNASFSIVGNQLQIVAPFDFETKNSYSIRVRTTDAGGLFFEKQFTITVTNVNETPTDITLSANSINENNAINAVIGTLSTTDVDAGDTFTYTLVAGAGSTDNASFNISGNSLRASIAFNFEAKSSYDIRIRTTDAGGLFYEEAFTITIINVNEAPTAATDALNYLSNTEVRVDGHAGTANAIAFTTTLVNPIDNDTDPDTIASGFGTISIVPVTGGTSPNGATYDIAADGTMRYTPPAGFTGTDPVPYQLTDGTNTVAGTINFTMTGTLRVWYVRNNDATVDGTATKDGTSSYPFNTLVAAQTASGVNDTIFVHVGDGLTTGQNAGFVMKNGQKLHGHAVGLNFDPDGAGVLTPVALIAASTQPQIGNAGGNGVTVATGLTGLEIRGLNIGASADAINMVVSGASNGGITIDTNTIRSAGTEGIDISHTSTGTTTVSLHDNAITSTGTSVLINKTAGTLTITAFDDNVISGNSAAGGISVTGAAFDAATGTAGFQTVSGGVTAIGASGNAVGTFGMILTNVTGDLSFTDLDIFAGNGTGLFASAVGNFNAGAATGFQLTASGNNGIIESVNGAAVDLSATAGNLLPANLVLTSILSTNSTGVGVSLTNVSGTFTVSGAGSAITNATGTDFAISGGSANVTYPGTITDDLGSLVTVASTTGGTKIFSGAITDGDDGDGSGISLTSNSGATIRFNGGVVLSTGANPAFAATGGGTVEICDEAVCNGAATGLLINKITTTTGTALNVANTTIGANDLEFRSINAGTAASGPATGIILNTTGALGGLSVKGTGAAGSGGTIRKAGTGISLTSTRDISLTSLQMNDFTDWAIRGSSVVNFTLANSVINGTNGDNDATDDGAIRFTELTGSAAITSCTISGGWEDNMAVVNTTGSLNRLTVSGTTFGANSTTFGNDALFVEAQNTATVNVTVTNSIFTSTRGDHFQFNVTGTPTADLIFTGNTITNNHPATVSGGGGIRIVSGAGSPTVTFAIGGAGALANTIRDSYGAAIGVTKGAGGGTFTGTIDNNDIGVSGVVDSGSRDGSGISLIMAESGRLDVAVTNNAIYQFNNYGIFLQTGGTAVVGTGDLKAVVTGNLIASPGSTAGFPVNGIHLNGGTLPGDAYRICFTIGGAGALENNFVGTGKNGGTDFRLRQRQSTTVYLNGYAGANNDDAAVVSFVQNRSTGTPTGAATNTVGSGGGGWSTAGCPF